MNKQKGFTLLEMMIVVAIMGVLAGAFIPTLFNQLDKADQGRTKHDLSQLASQVKYYYIDERKYPNNGTGLTVLIPDYLSELPIDPYGREYLYKKKKRGVLVYTLGEDGKVGGEGSDTDIYELVTRGNVDRPTPTPNDDAFNPFKV
tara:strand:- start:100 stop:537 length:438 start_codon:yes stop_codon:yes gene_type:complete